MGTFQARPSPAGDHFSGRPFSADWPSRAGPRHSGQLFADERAAGEHHAAGEGAREKDHRDGPRGERPGRLTIGRREVMDFSGNMAERTPWRVYLDLTPDDIVLTGARQATHGRTAGSGCDRSGCGISTDITTHMNYDMTPDGHV